MDAKTIWNKLSSGSWIFDSNRSNPCTPNGGDLRKSVESLQLYHTKLRYSNAIIPCSVYWFRNQQQIRRKEFTRSEDLFSLQRTVVVARDIGVTTFALLKWTSLTISVTRSFTFTVLWRAKVASTRVACKSVLIKFHNFEFHRNLNCNQLRV